MKFKVSKRSHFRTECLTNSNCFSSTSLTSLSFTPNRYPVSNAEGKPIAENQRAPHSFYLSTNCHCNCCKYSLVLWEHLCHNLILKKRHNVPSIFKYSPVSSVIREFRHFPEFSEAKPEAEWSRIRAVKCPSELDPWPHGESEFFILGYLAPKPLVSFSNSDCKMFHLDFQNNASAISKSPGKGRMKVATVSLLFICWTWHCFWYREGLNKYMLTDWVLKCPESSSWSSIFTIAEESHHFQDLAKHSFMYKSLLNEWTSSGDRSEKQLPRYFSNI